MITKLHQFFEPIWQQEIPQDFRDTTTIHLYKRMEHHSAYDNHCDVSLLSIASLCILEKNTYQRANVASTKERGPMNVVFAARQLQERCQEQNADFFCTFEGLTMALNTVCLEGLSKITTKSGCPKKFISIMQQFHNGMQVRVQDFGDESNTFPATNAQKQARILALTL